MNIRWSFASVLLAAVVAVGTATAQQPAAPRTVAKLVDIKGNVLVSQGDAMSAAGKDQRLPVGSRVVTTAGATVIISYDKGCDVKLEENRRFVVRELGECAALIASIETLTPAGGAVGGGAVAAAGGAISTPVVVGLAVLAGAAGVAIYQNNRNNNETNNVSPN